MTRLGVGLLALYPQAWRQRYAEEMRALLAEQTVGLRVLADLLRGALDAHLRPQGLLAAPLVRMRNTVGAALCCWIAFVVCGAGFAKLTEDPAFAMAAARHPLLGAARLGIVILAALSAAAVLLGGARLVVEVLRAAWTERRRPLLRAVCAPLAAVAIVVAATAVFAWLASTGRVQAHSVGGWIVFLAWSATGLGGAGVCGLAPRTALRLVNPRPAALRTGVRGAAALSLVLVLATLAIVLYAIAVAVEVPALANAANGPFGLLSTTAALAVLVVALATISALAAITSTRGLQALRAAG